MQRALGVGLHDDLDLLADPHLDPLGRRRPHRSRRSRDRRGRAVLLRLARLVAAPRQGQYGHECCHGQHGTSHDDPLVVGAATTRARHLCQNPTLTKAGATARPPARRRAEGESGEPAVAPSRPGAARPRDPDDADAPGHRRDLRPGRLRLRPRPAADAGRGADLVRAPLPAAGCSRCPAGWPTPAWVDDPHFDLAFHVRRSALPRPGSMEQLRELVARIVSRPLDRSRPLWEVVRRRGARGRPGRGAVEVAPGAGRRDRHRRPRAGAARPVPGAASARRRRVAAGPAVLAARACCPTPSPTSCRTRGSRWDAVRAQHRLRGPRRRRRGRPGRARRRGARQPAPGARLPDHGRGLAAAPGRHRPHRAGRPPPGPRGQRRLGQRRRPGDDRRGAPELADDPRRVARRAYAGSGPWRRCR